MSLGGNVVEGFGELRTGDPERLGPFALLGRIGSGAMGQVYLGRSPSGRRVAVKTLRIDRAADDSFRRRFSREIAAARSVSGFYTAAIIDADSAAPLPWFATAYVCAPDMAELVGVCGPFSARSLPCLAAQLAEAVVAIHRVGLVHRDIKPGNIVVTADGPQVLDFGIARWPDAETYLLGMGTPAYSSPEQFTAAADSLGSPSDLYSLASTLTFAASGRPPYTGNSALAIIDSVRSGAPDLTSLPEPLRQLIAPCVEFRPRDRPTAEQLLAGLEQLISDEEESPLSVTQARYVAEFAAKRQTAARLTTTRVRKPSWTTRTGEIDLESVQNMTPVVDGEHVLVPTDTEIIRLDAATGRWISCTPRAQHPDGTPELPPPGVPLSFAGTFIPWWCKTGTLSLVAATEGVLWQRDLRPWSGDGPIHVSHDVTHGDLAAVSRRTVFLFDLLTGQLLWEADLRGAEATWSQPLLTENAVVVHDEFGYLHALDRSTGRSLWTVGEHCDDILMPRHTGTAPFLVETEEAGLPPTVWVPLRRRWYGPRPWEKARMRRFDLSSGEELPIRTGGIFLYGQPQPGTAADGRVYISETSSGLHVLDAVTTEHIHTVMGLYPAGSPVIFRGRVYVNSFMSKLHAVSVETLDI
ncbi:protein kinase [Streptomyces microflavus]|uniref:serine/threonine-protein kinase n=1 Tax=Streptomyces microflavus TaxID=1919 RepID=UPI0034051381